MRISPEVEIALSLAATEAARRRHEFLTIEHLLYALLFDDETAKAVKAAGGDLKDLKKKLERFFDERMEAMAEDAIVAPQPTMGVQNAIRRAAAHVQSSGKDEVKGANVLVAMFAERDSFAMSLLEGAGVTRLDLVAYISHGVPKDGDDEDGAGEEGELAGRSEEGAGKKEKDPLQAYTINLNEEAKNKRIDPLIGRANEVDRIIQILARRKKNNPLLVGDPGVGKTAIAEGLALEDHARRGAEGAEERRRLLARHGLAPGGHALPRRLRGAHQGGAEGARRRSPAPSSSSTRSTRSSAPGRPAAAAWTRPTC